MNQEKKFKVMFGENKIINGICYGKSVYNLTPETALAAVREGGVMAESEKQALNAYLKSQPEEGAPLSLEETMERFQNFDFSDDVMRSLQYHQAAIQEKAQGLQPPAMYGDINKNTESTIDLSKQPNSGVSGGVPAGNQSGLNVGESFDPNARENAANQSNGLTEETGEGEPETDLPEGFPAREELIAGGVTTLAKLRSMKKADILAIDKIGDAKANQIGARLAAMAEEGN